MEINVEETKVMRISRQQPRVLIMMRQKRLKNVKYVRCLCKVITNDSRFTRENNSTISIEKQRLTRREIFPLANWT